MLAMRGNTPRLFQNTLVFFAIDQIRLQDLDEAVRRYLARESIVTDAESGALELTTHQIKQAKEQDAGRIADEVTSHLAGLVGADVKVTLGISADLQNGVSEKVVRTVTENCRTTGQSRCGGTGNHITAWGRSILRGVSHRCCDPKSKGCRSLGETAELPMIRVSGLTGVFVFIRETASWCYFC